MIHSIKNKKPTVPASAFVAWNAEVAGDVCLGENTNIWFSATIRADIAPVHIGTNSNIQDNAAIHVDTNLPCIIEENVTVGHGAILHSCKIGSGTTVGMGAIILNGAQIGENSMVAAGSLVSPNKIFPPKSMIMGSPAKVVRELTDQEVASMKENACHYVELSSHAKNDYREVSL
ncbi:MAG: gamma carbonic anhydrase family protein [Treponemataceae bacterium]